MLPPYELYVEVVTLLIQSILIDYATSRCCILSRISVNDVSNFGEKC